MFWGIQTHHTSGNNASERLLSSRSASAAWANAPILIPETVLLTLQIHKSKAELYHSSPATAKALRHRNWFNPQSREPPPYLGPECRILVLSYYIDPIRCNTLRQCHWIESAIGTPEHAPHLGESTTSTPKCVWAGGGGSILETEIRIVAKMCTATWPQHDFGRRTWGFVAGRYCEP